MKFVAGIIVGLIIAMLVPVILIYTGSINMAATARPGQIEKQLGAAAYVNSMQKRAPNTQNPYTKDVSALSSGREHYKENCVICHGAPGDVPPDEFAEGLNPPAPMLDIPSVKNMTDGQLYWTIKHGIRMTAMPAFGPTHTDEEIWKIAAFVRHLPELTPEEIEDLKSATQKESHHEEAENQEKDRDTRQTKPHEHVH